MAIDKDLLNPGETIVISTRTHPKALILPILALVVLLAVGVFVQTQIDERIVSLVVPADHSWTGAHPNVHRAHVRPRLVASHQTACLI